MIGRETILRLIPHAGAMCLWDEVVSWNAGSIALRAHNHRHAEHPLRSEGRLSAVHLCEYGAQAMAVHGGLLAQASGQPAKPGLLVALRAVELNIERIDDLADPLECHAELLIEHETGWQYAFRITHAEILLAQGRAAVMMTAQSSSERQ